MLAEKKSSNVDATFSPEDLTPEVIAAAYLMNRMRSLPKEAAQDLASLAPEIAECDSKEKFREIMDTIREIIFPELLGNARECVTEPGDETLQKHTEWVAAKVKDLRKASGMTQDDLATKSGLPQSHISRIENAQHSPSNKTLGRIADALGVDISELDPSEW